MGKEGWEDNGKGKVGEEFTVIGIASSLLGEGPWSGVKHFSL